MRSRLIRALAVVLGIGAGVGVAAVSSSAAATPPPTASFTAADVYWSVSGSTGNQANIAPGGTVTFSYPAGASHHNADFTGGLSPTSCTQSTGADSGAVPPLPHQPTAPGWSGTCTFDTPGTYTFHCDMHAFMTGTIVVGDATTTTGGSTTSATRWPPSSTASPSTERWTSRRSAEAAVPRFSCSRPARHRGSGVAGESAAWSAGRCPRAGSASPSRLTAPRAGRCAVRASLP